MSKIIFVTGGARSGKSRFAVERAKRSNSVLYIATCRRSNDKEMQKRIKMHVQHRPASWKVAEEPIKLKEVIEKNAKFFKVVLIDCLTLWVTNMILAKKSEAEILDEISNVIKTMKKKKALFIIVSNEVGMGLVPVTKLGRYFRDVAGKVNQVVAKMSNEVYLLVSGISLKIK